MPLSRREFLVSAVAGVTMTALPSSLFAGPGEQPRYRAIAFDAFVIFDPRPVFAFAEKLFPGRGGELSALWRTRQFEYMWLRTLSERYADFPTVTRDALSFAAKSLHLDLRPAPQKALLDCYFQLKAWPDVQPALRRFREAGIKLGLLSNFSEAMLTANIQNSNLADSFDQILSTDRVKAFKPDRRAYQMGIDAFGLRKDEIVFAAFAGWDAAGAKSFGYPTFWINRQNAPEEELGAAPDAIGSIFDLARFVNITPS